jgi:ribose-phosphate pyrophosphokinase
MAARPLALFAMEASRDYGGRVAKRLGLSLSPHEERPFEDGEHKSRPLIDVRGQDAYVIHSLYGDEQQSANDKLCRLLFFIGALKDAGAARVTAVTPYLCYARKDRRTKPQDPIITRYVAALFEASGADQVAVIEVHNVAAFENAFRCPTQHLDTAELFAAHFAPLAKKGDIVVVSPDAGGVKRANLFRQALEQATGQEIGSAFVEKYRSAGVVSGNMLVGQVEGKVVVIMDDLISTGTTLLRAANACRAGGARRIFAAAAHGLFMAGATELLADPAFEKIVIADTVSPFRVAPDAAQRRLTILDSTFLVARAIEGSHKDH